MTVPPPVWVSMLAVLGYAGLAMALLQRLRLRWPDRPEALRKLFHLAGGVAALALPLLFGEVWPVATVAAVMLAVFGLIRVVPALRAGVGQVVHGVQRGTEGEIWYILGILAAFWLAHDDMPAYAAGILMVVLADTAAALVGTRWGRARVGAGQGAKSLEGSAAFLATGFVCTLVPLLASGRCEGALAVGVALNVALVATLAEAVSPRGSDNLVLPPLTVGLFGAFTAMGEATVRQHTVGLVVLLVVLAVLYRPARPVFTGLMLLALTSYLLVLFGSDWGQGGST